MSFIPSLIFFILSFPLPDEFDFSFESQFRVYSRFIIVTLCLINLHLFYCNLFL